MKFSDVKVFFRTLWRNKLYTVITVFGFALSLTFVILLGAYIRQELSVDQFHVNKDRIFRAVNEEQSNFGTLIGGELQNKYPEIECYTRLSVNGGFVENVQKEKVAFNFLLVDSTFFKMFSFRLLEGNPEDALKVRNSVVLTRSYARKVFGDRPALGQELIFDNRLNLLVTGIMEDMPENTHFDAPDGLLLFPLLADIWQYPELFQNNGNSSFGLYFMTKNGTDLSSKAPQILEGFKKDYWMYRDGFKKEFGFEPLTSIYFGGKGGQGMHGNSQTLVAVLSAIAMIILILALINYNNLSVAQAGFRAKEAAVKKLLGTDNLHLFRQFVGESVALCFMAFFIALGFSILLQPVFNQLLVTHISIAGQLTFVNLMIGLAAVGLLGIIAGLAPAFMITRFNPVDVVKGAFRRKTRGVYSKVLICFQYTVAIILMISTIVILKQTDYMRNYNLGFDKGNIVWLGNRIDRTQSEAFRSELEKIPAVKGVSYTCGTPVDGGNNMSFSYKEKSVSFQEFKVDSAFFNLLGIKMEPTGVAFSENGVWMNRAGVKELELGESPTEYNPGNGVTPIMGIVDNFHFRALTNAVGPAQLRPLRQSDYPWTILVKIAGSNPGETFNEIKRVYSEYIDKAPFESGFMDQDINQWYEGNERTAKLIGYFSALAIVLSMMGILAMATYFIQQRVKEIGVRRVNGATVMEVLSLLVNSFMKWIVVAFIIACPVAWYAMNKWLSGFAYRTDLSWWIFVAAGIFACVIALIMVGWQSIKAATTNPVNSLKME